MKPDFTDIKLHIEITKDGSPTLRMANAGESMHHSGGAASETRYIYQSVIDKGYTIKSDSQIAVVGLGLGYIEISWAMSLISKPKQLTSFEKIPELSRMFTNWLATQETAIYDDICHFMGAKTTAEIATIKSKLLENFNLSPIQDDVLNYSDKKQWNIICYDAYSSKTNQELWSESYLQKFLTEHAHQDCVLTTYACTGILKRVLANLGFQVIQREGFQGKRDSTLALRGVFKDHWSLDRF